MTETLIARHRTDWAGYDVVILNTSGGKDSQTMLRKVAAELAEQGFAGRLVVVHCDLGRMEWDGVRDLAIEQGAAYGFEVEVVSRPQGDLLDQIADRGMMPGPSTRFCTSDHKTAQVAKVMTREAAAWHLEHAPAGKKRSTRRCRIANVLGLRAQESDKRAEKLAGGHETPNGRLSNATMREVVDVHPIASWTEAEVWADIKASGVRYHEAYDLGMPRLSCRFCIFASRSVLMLAGIHNREALEEYVEVEREIGFQFRGRPGSTGNHETGPLALSEILAAIDRGETPDPDALTFGDMG